MDRFTVDNDQNDHDFAKLKADVFAPLRQHYRRQWYVDQNVGYWLGEQGLVRPGDESRNARTRLKVFDPVAELGDWETPAAAGKVRLGDWVTFEMVSLIAQPSWLNSLALSR